MVYPSMNSMDIANIALEGIEFDAFDELIVEYKCDCTRERVERALITLGENDLLKMLDEQEAEGKARELEVKCRFCTRKEIFNESDIDKKQKQHYNINASKEALCLREKLTKNKIRLLILTIIGVSSEKWEGETNWMSFEKS